MALTSLGGQSKKKLRHYLPIKEGGLRNKCSLAFNQQGVLADEPSAEEGAKTRLCKNGTTNSLKGASECQEAKH